MLLVLPVSKADYLLVPKLAAVFAKLGGLSEQDALVVTIPENVKLAEEYARLLTPTFRKVDVHLLQGQCPEGWPQACNFYFARTAQYLEFERKIEEPWYYFEADTLPLKAGWLEKLATEYNLAGKPFMGCLQETYRSLPDSNDVVVDGAHMVGTGIYPPRLSQYSVLYRFAGAEPWDVLCQWEIAPHLHATKLIQHNWGTVNYTLQKDGSVTCEDREVNRWGIKHDKPLSPDVVLLHGVKDSSLADLVLADFSVVAQPEKPAPEKPAPTAEKAPKPTGAVSALAALSRATA
jgi:hypothetical protein